MSPDALRALSDDLLAWMPSMEGAKLLWASKLRRKIDQILLGRAQT